jgi:hypothetical protein
MLTTENTGDTEFANQKTTELLSAQRFACTSFSVRSLREAREGVSLLPCSVFSVPSVVV